MQEIDFSSRAGEVRLQYKRRRKRYASLRERTKAWLCSASAISLVSLAGCTVSPSDWMDTVMGPTRDPQQLNGPRRVPVLNPGTGVRRPAMEDAPVEEDHDDEWMMRPYDMDKNATASRGESSQDDTTLDRWFTWLKKPETDVGSEAERLRAERKPLPGNPRMSAGPEIIPQAEQEAQSQIADAQEEIKEEASAEVVDAAPKMLLTKEEEQAVALMVPPEQQEMLTEDTPKKAVVSEQEMASAATESPEVISGHDGSAIPAFIPFGPPSSVLDDATLSKAAAKAQIRREQTAKVETPAPKEAEVVVEADAAPVEVAAEAVEKPVTKAEEKAPAMEAPEEQQMAKPADKNVPIDLTPESEDVAPVKDTPFPWLDESTISAKPQPVSLREEMPVPNATQSENQDGLIGKIRNWLTVDEKNTIDSVEAPIEMKEITPAEQEHASVEVTLEPQLFAAADMQETPTLEKPYPQLEEVPDNPKAFSRVKNTHAKEVNALQQTRAAAKSAKQALDSDPEPGSFMREVQSGETQTPAGVELPEGVQDTDLQDESSVQKQPAPKQPKKRDAVQIVKSREEEAVIMTEVPTPMQAQHELKKPVVLPWLVENTASAKPVPQRIPEQEYVQMTPAAFEAASLTQPPIPPAIPAEPRRVAAQEPEMPKEIPFKPAQVAYVPPSSAVPEPVAAIEELAPAAGAELATTFPDAPPPPVALASEAAKPYTSANKVRYLRESRYAERRRMLAMRRSTLAN